MSLEIVTPPRSGTVSMLFLLESANISGNLGLDIITNRHEYSAFANNDNLNIFISRDPVDAICSIFLYEDVEYSDLRCSELISYIEKFYTFFNKYDSPNNIFVDFKDLVNSPKEVLIGLLSIIGIEKDSAKLIIESEIFKNTYADFLKSDKETVTHKQHFPRVEDNTKRQNLKRMINNNKNIEDLLLTILNTKSIIEKTSHTKIKISSL